MGIQIIDRPLYPGQDGYGNGLTGVETTSRQNCGLNNVPTMTSGVLRFAYFTPPATTVVSKCVTSTGGTAAGATPTLCRVGLYSVAANGDLTLVASMANDTTMWASTNTEYEKNLSASYTVVGGQRYAAAALCVTGTTPPNLFGAVPSHGASAVFARAPRLAAIVNSQTDLPASVSVGSLSNSTTSLWVGFVA